MGFVQGFLFVNYFVNVGLSKKGWGLFHNLRVNMHPGVKIHVALNSCCVAVRCYREDRYFLLARVWRVGRVTYVFVLKVSLGLYVYVCIVYYCVRGMLFYYGYPKLL